MPSELLGHFYNEVIEPLANDGADTGVFADTISEGEAAIRENIVEFGIKESLSQRALTQKWMHDDRCAMSSPTRSRLDPRLNKTQ